MDTLDNFEYYQLPVEERTPEGKSKTEKSEDSVYESQSNALSDSPEINKSFLPEKLKSSFKIIEQKTDDLKNFIKDKKDRTKEFLLEKRRTKQIKNQLRTLDRIEDKYNSINSTPEEIMTYDKRVFCLGIFIMLITNALLFYPNPDVIMYWFTFINQLLMALRFIDYYSKGDQFYFLDFCYYANIFVQIYMYFTPQNYVIFLITFMFVGGPVILSIPLFGMKLVLHDTDSLCTFSMHYYPLLIMFRYRHYQYDLESKFLTSYQIDDWLHNFGMYDLTFYYIISLLAYSCWSVQYYWVVFVKLNDYLKKNRNPTLYSYLFSVDGIWNGISMVLQDWTPIVYLLGHGTLAIIGNLFCFLCLYSKLFMAFYLVTMYFMTTYNGSIYYFDYFTKGYDQKIITRANAKKQKKEDVQINRKRYDTSKESHNKDIK